MEERLYPLITKMKNYLQDNETKTNLVLHVKELTQLVRGILTNSLIIIFLSAMALRRNVSSEELSRTLQISTLEKISLEMKENILSFSKITSNIRDDYKLVIADLFQLRIPTEALSVNRFKQLAIIKEIMQNEKNKMFITKRLIGRDNSKILIRK